MTWFDCPFIYRDNDGNAVVIGTTVWPQDIVMLREHGAQWMTHAFKVRLEVVEAILEFDDKLRSEEPVRRYG